MILLGLGAGIAFNPVLLAAMSDVEPSEAGLASGVVNTAFMMGGALGLAVLASVAASRTDSCSPRATASVAALTGGYHAAFLARRALRRRRRDHRRNLPPRGRECARRGGGSCRRPRRRVLLGGWHE